MSSGCFHQNLTKKLEEINLGIYAQLASSITSKFQSKTMVSFLRTYLRTLHCLSTKSTQWDLKLTQIYCFPNFSRFRMLLLPLVVLSRLVVEVLVRMRMWYLSATTMHGSKQKIYSTVKFIWFDLFQFAVHLYIVAQRRNIVSRILLYNEFLLFLYYRISKI